MRVAPVALNTHTKFDSVPLLFLSRYVELIWILFEIIIWMEALFLWSSGFGPMSMLTVEWMYKINSLSRAVFSHILQDKTFAALMQLKIKAGLGNTSCDVLSLSRAYQVYAPSDDSRRELITFHITPGIAEMVFISHGSFQLWRRHHLRHEAHRHVLDFWAPSYYLVIRKSTSAMRSV